MVITEKLILLWGGLFLVVSETTVDDDSFCFNAVDKTVRFIDPAAELTAFGIFEKFRLSDSFQGSVPGNAFQKIVDFLESLFVLLLPVEIICPRSIRKQILQNYSMARSSSRVFVTVRPCFVSSTDRSSFAR